MIRAERPEKRLVLVNRKDAKGNPALHYAVYNRGRGGCCVLAGRVASEARAICLRGSTSSAFLM